MEKLSTSEVISQKHDRGGTPPVLLGLKRIKLLKRPKIIKNIKESKASRVIKIPKAFKVDDKRIRYVNPITLKNYVLRPTYLPALRKINPISTRLLSRCRTGGSNPLR